MLLSLITFKFKLAAKKQNKTKQKKNKKVAAHTQNLLVVTFYFSLFRKHNKNRTIIDLPELSPVAIHASSNISGLSLINVNITFLFYS